MIRILMNRKQYSPFLKTLSGTIQAEHINFDDVDVEKSFHGVTRLLVCNFAFAKTELTYTNIVEDKKNIFKLLKWQIDNMILSYIRGMTLAPHDHSYVEGSGKDLNEWLKKRRKEYENQ
jgi:hypothetical protein